jgi:WD40 repeat protein
LITRLQNVELIHCIATLYCSVRSKFDSQVSFLDHEAGTITGLLFHPYENIVISSDDQDIVSVWNWSDNTKLNTFNNGGRITSMKLVNDNHQQVMLLTGSDDGVVRCWRNFTQATGALELATSWRAMSDLGATARGRGAGLVLNWCQADGWLVCVRCKPTPPGLLSRSADDGLLCRWRRAMYQLFAFGIWSAI